MHDHLGRRGGCTFQLPLFALIFILSFWMVSAAMAMGDNLIGQVFDQLQERFNNAVEWLFDPIYGWIFWTVVAILGLGLISWFAPFDWVKKINAVIAIVLIAFTAGGWKMGQNYKRRLQEERQKRKELEEAKRQNRNDGNRSGGGWFGNWGN